MYFYDSCVREKGVQFYEEPDHSVITYPREIYGLSAEYGCSESHKHFSTHYQTYFTKF